MIHGQDLAVGRRNKGSNASDREQEGSEKHVGTFYTTASGKSSCGGLPTLNSQVIVNRVVAEATA